MGMIRGLRVGAMRGALAALVLAVCAACASGPAPVDTKVDTVAEGLAQVAAQEYQLGAGDQVKVNVFGEPDLTGEFVVGSTGMISYPLVGDIPAKGKTVAEFSEALAAILQKGYVRQPKISVEVMNYRPFFILGEVGKPGTYPYSSSLTVMNAVATAGGFSYRADTKRVFIKHASEASERPYALTSATSVQPGDTVRIPERRF